MKPAIPAPPARTGHRHGPAGFTLIELLVTIVVLSILLALAVPSFRSFMQNDQQWAQTNNLLLGLNTARSEAIKDDVNGAARICSSNDGLTCTGTAWDQGWIVLGVDPASPNNPPKLLQVVGPLATGTTLTESANNFNIGFTSTGALGALANPENAVAFKMCDARGPAFARYLQISAMGRVSASQTPGQDLTGAAIAACP